MARICSTLALAAFFILGLNIAHGQTPEVYMGNRLLKSNTQAEIINDRMMVPLRMISEELGYQIIWLENDKAVYLTDGETGLMLKIGNKLILQTDGKGNMTGTKIVETPPVIKGGRTLAPLRFIAEGMALKVDWIAQENRVVISK